MRPVGDITIDEVNRSIRLFGTSQKAFMRREQRAHLRSLLFDVPRRSSIGWHCIYAAGVPFLRRLAASLAPEDIGRRMKRLCSRPYYLQLSILMSSYLGARQQRLLDLGLSPGDADPEENLEEMAFLCDFWHRAACTYRNDGQPLPAEGGDTQPILPPREAAELAERLAPAQPESHKRLRRLAATLELYCFILHGEQRDGIFAHGPYELGDGTALVVLEFNDLQNEFLPWAQTAARLPLPHVAMVMRLKGVRTRFDLFGGVLFDPADIAPHVLAEGLFTRATDGSIAEVRAREMEAIRQAAAEAQNELYLKAATWPPRYKAEYGVHLFANHLQPFVRLASEISPSIEPGRVEEEIRSAFAAAAAGEIEGLLERSEPPSIWKFMATTEGEYFWPVTAQATLTPRSGHLG